MWAQIYWVHKFGMIHYIAYISLPLVCLFLYEKQLNIKVILIIGSLGGTLQSIRRASSLTVPVSVAVPSPSSCSSPDLPSLPSASDTATDGTLQSSSASKVALLLGRVWKEKQIGIRYKFNYFVTG